MTAKAKIAVLDTSFSAIPLVEAIDFNKAEIFVVGSKPNDFLTKFQQTSHIEANYSNVGRVSKILAEAGIDFIIPGCNDVSYTSYASLISTSTNLLTTFRSLNNKSSFREKCKSANLSTPKTYENLESAIGKSVLIKPCVSFSGQGISYCNEKSTMEDLRSYAKTAQKVSQDGNYVIEEFIVGQLFSVSIFLESSQIKNCYIVKEYCLENPFVVNWSFIDRHFAKMIKNEFFDQFASIPYLLGLSSGLLHLQCIKANNGKIYLIECTLRCPGDLYPYLIELQTGDNYSNSYLQEFIPKDFLKTKVRRNADAIVVRHTSSHYEKNIFKGFQHNGKQTLISFPTLKFGDENSKGNKFRSGVHFYLEAKPPSVTQMINHQTKSELCYGF